MAKYKNEKELVDALIKGSHQAFDEIYRLYAPKLYGFILSLTKSETITSDIVQDTFIKLWDNASKLDSSYPLRSYLFAMARNQTTDNFRSQLHRYEMVDYIEYVESLAVDSQSVYQHIDFETFYLQLSAAKRKLSTRQCEIFEMCKEKGYSVSETATITGLSPQTVSNHLTTSLQIVRKHLKPTVMLLIIHALQHIK